MNTDPCPGCGIGKVVRSGNGPFGPRYRCTADGCNWMFDKTL